MNSLIESLNAHAPDIVRWIAGFELQIAVLALLVWLLDRWLRKSTPVLRYSIWLIVLAKAFIPPFIFLAEIRIPIAEFTAPPMLAVGVETGNVTATPASNALHVLPANMPALSLWSMLLIVWVLFALVLLVVSVFRSASLHRRLRGASDMSDWSDKYADMNPGGRYRKPQIFVTDAIDTPLTTGFFRPKIYLTPELAASDSIALHSVFQHELAHIRRLDLWIVLLQNIASVLHPVNPLLRLMNTKLHQYREMICDEHALRSSNVDALEYGRLLLDLVERNIRRPQFTADAIYFYETKKGLKERIFRIAYYCEETPNRQRLKQYALVFLLCEALVPFAWQCSTDNANYKTTPSYMVMRCEEFEMLTACDMKPEQTWGADLLSDPIYILRKANSDANRKEADDEFIFKVRLDAAGKVQSAATVKGFKYPGVGELLKSIYISKWKPAKRGGGPVDAEFLLPLRFYLTSKKSYVRDNAGQTYDTPPQPVGGMHALYNALTYPDDALAKGIQGTVLLQVTVLSNGWVDKVLVLNSPDARLSTAAKEAARNVSWTPAKYKDKPISWADVKVPVEFTLQAKEGERTN